MNYGLAYGMEAYGLGQRLKIGGIGIGQNGHRPAQREGAEELAAGHIPAGVQAALKTRGHRAFRREQRIRDR